MNAGLIISDMAPRVYLQPQNLSGLADVTRCPARTAVAKAAAGKAVATEIRNPVPVLSALRQTDIFLEAGTVLQARSEVVMQRQAEAQDVLIYAAEVALVSQAVRPYWR
ncbi:hypothetical protein ABU178_19205 [Pantoea osteomyelitidis]|uniref:Uncharacterized protein n=1 Tax=Pantoea osteomyelitidis TaxID=3230026 RepID=A0ABW7Q4C4_9GAMM